MLFVLFGYPLVIIVILSHETDVIVVFEQHSDDIGLCFPSLFSFNFMF